MTGDGGLTLKLRHEGQKGDVSRSLDCDSQPALMLGARTGLATRANLAPVTDVTLQDSQVLVVDDGCIFTAELTNFSAAGKTPSPTSIIAHAYVLLVLTFCFI